VKRQWLTLFLLFAVIGLLRAQETVIAPDTPVNDDILHQWLHSGDPRLIAWAADFARRTRDAKIIGEMPGLLEHWNNMPPAYGGDEAQEEQRRAMDALLDALIQENAVVPIPAISAVARPFPTQAAILIGRLPLAESRDTLRGWIFGPTETSDMLARVASMILAKDPGTNGWWDGQFLGFVAATVAASEERLEITVRAASKKEPGTGIGVCGDGATTPIVPGWPAVFTYYIQENRPQANVLVVDLDGDDIGAIRYQENFGYGECGDPPGFEPLDRYTRHRLLAYWLGVPDSKMSWQPVSSFTIIWAGKAAYEQRLGEIVATESGKLRATTQALHRRGLLYDDEAATVSPQLVVHVECKMDPCPLK
jgi:hypothetical protein